MVGLVPPLEDRNTSKDSTVNNSGPGVEMVYILPVPKSVAFDKNRSESLAPALAKFSIFKVVGDIANKTPLLLHVLAPVEIVSYVS